MRTDRFPLLASLALSLIVVACAPTASHEPSTSPASPGVSPAIAASATPRPTPAPTVTPVAPPTMGRIAAGYVHACAITETGGVTCWGSGDPGSGSGDANAVPVDVPGLESGVNAISAGGFHTCALTSGGGVKCWGSNEYGQLGDGTRSDSDIPVDVEGLASGVSAISVGWSHTCALTAVGGVKCWGNNVWGWLGNGTQTDSSVPVDVVGLGSGVSAVAAGVLHTCAIASGGKVMCWGHGQADDPDLAHSTVPVPVPGLPSGVTAISAGNDETCALTRDGDVWCWGPSYAFPQGGDQADRSSRVDVSGLAGGVSAIAVGEAHSCALTGLGGAACWGNDSHGELGVGVTSTRSVAIPAEVSGLDGDVTAIAVGGRHTCALTTTGIRCWGSNDHGQLGVRMPCSSISVPVEVGGVAPPPRGAPPSGLIAHAKGPTDVVLRYDHGPDIGVSELGGEQFSPGPEFTLYGDGTVIFRSTSGEAPQADGRIVRGQPFRTARLDEADAQALLRYALEEGGLTDACERYETNDTDVSDSHTLTVRAGGLVKRIDVGGPSPLGPLLEELGAYTPAPGMAAPVYAPERYWATLFEAAPAIEIGLIPKPSEVGSAPWPWPGLTPADFSGRDEGGWIGYPRRVMSSDEASVLDLSADGGVVQRVYIVGPDDKTIYYFSLWPMAPDEPR